MPPRPKPYSFGTAGLSADKITKVDPDYLYFLNHVRLDGRAYTVDIPSKDGVSLPEVIKYEQPLAGVNAEDPVIGPEGGGKGSSSAMEEGKSAAGEVPSGGASPPAFVKTPIASRDGGAGSGAVPMDEDNLAAPAAEPDWYDSDPNIDEDYRLFLQHARAVNDAEMVLEMGDFSVTLGDDSEAEEDDEEEEEEEEDGDGDVGTEDEEKEKEKEMVNEKVKEESEAEEEDHIPDSREDDVGTEEDEGEKDDGENAEREVEAGYDYPMADLSDFEELAEKVKDEEESIAVDGGVGKGKYEKENEEGEAGTAPDWPMVNVFEFEGPLQKVEEVVEEEEQPLNLEASSSKGHDAVPQNTSELQGAIWPTHIIDRPESDFKQKLMEVLNKPFNQEEYDDLLAMATNRTPVIKERRTRRRVVNYPWKYEMGKSYFDRYPDLANQVEGNSYPNRLALLRGFFFWLKNIGHEDQFRPWRDDYRKYRVFHEYYP